MASSNLPDPLIHRDDITRAVYATDNSIYQVTPHGVSVPTHAEQVQQVLRDNAEGPMPRAVVARGGGTGTNGQSLTDGIMLDLKRGMNKVLAVDVENRTATVEPGLVTAKLNEDLRAHGLFWAPHTSTLNRATVGGMIATDAAGKGSLVYGRAHRHVLSLDICLADGSMFVAEPVSIAEAQRRAGEAGRAGEVWRALLDLPITEGQDFGLPELARGFSGYGIDRLRRDGLIDPVALLVGAEGTLGIVTKATLSLQRLPAHTTLIAAAYASFADALNDAVELRATSPTAVECFDEHTLVAAKSSPAWGALDHIVDDRCRSMLLVEYSSDEPRDEISVHGALEASGRALLAATIATAPARAQAWKVRADAVGLIAKVEVGAPARSARPTAMVEDCAVPVANMVDFIADFRAVLDGFGLKYAMFGHADVGCVHVRPALDTTDPTHEALVRELTDAVVETVKTHHGVLWGEHGRGFRGAVASAFLGPDTIALMRQVKAIFDPNDLLNPGKLYRPAGSHAPLTDLDGAPMRGQIDRGVPVDIRREFGDAFACNGNGLCQQYSANEVMCPSYTATGDPALSPRGRVDLLRSYLLRRERGGDEAFEDGLATNLSKCLSCSACTGSCPVEVDIPELKSQFLEQYYAERKRPVAHGLLSRFETLASLSTTSPTLVRYGTKPAGRALGLVDLPSPKKRTLHHAYPTFSRRKSRAFDVVVLRDVFTDRLEPDTIVAAADVLASLGLDVALSSFVPSGKFDHVTGKRKEFRKAVAAQGDLVRSILAAGAVPVAIEPAVALLHDHEYRSFDPQYPHGVQHLVDVLFEHRTSLRNGSSPNPAVVTVLGHCTERATRPESLVRWKAVLEAAGYRIDVPEMGCCGMAGIFGHEAENQELSRALWNSGWDEQVRGRTGVVATGYSCRSQAERLSLTAPPHPIWLLHNGYAALSVG